MNTSGGTRRKRAKDAPMGRQPRFLRRKLGGTTTIVGILLVTMLGATANLRAQESDEVAALRRELAVRQAEIAQQREQLSRQQAELERQAQELAALAARLDQTLGAPTQETATASAKAVAPVQAPLLVRDSVGDLNAASVAAGDFPGSIKIPGTANLSLAIGGFVKTVAIRDSRLEGTGAIFLPAFLGAGRPDTDGGASFDATLARLDIDAQAPTANGSLRGYVEWDLNGPGNGSPGFNLRHAYGAWRTGKGTLTVGHTWSTTMDLKILPEGLTEPTVSGAIFQRQAQMRWSQPVSKLFKFDVALEDSSSSDLTIAAPWRATTSLPDLVGAAEWDWGRTGHLRLTGLVRQLEVADSLDHSERATAWGLSAGAHVGVGKSDKLAFSASAGKGNGRYLLGLAGGQAGFLEASSGNLRLLRGTGWLTTYRHAWSESLRTTAGFGNASVADENGLGADAFDSSSFGLLNLMWSPRHYLTFGGEYQYGRREAKDGSRRDNHRVIFGVQVF